MRNEGRGLGRSGAVFAGRVGWIVRPAWRISLACNGLAPGRSVSTAQQDGGSRVKRASHAKPGPGCSAKGGQRR